MSTLRPTAVLTGLSLVATGLLLIPASPASAQTTFRPGDSLALGDPAGDVQLADVDADGDLDQIVSFPGRVELLVPSVAAVDVLLGDGTGGFAAAARVTVPEAGFVAAGDLNGDGAADVVVAPPGALRVSVLLADRTGGLGAARTFGSGAGAPGAIELADMTGDGFLDIVVGSKPSAAVSVLPGNGDGTFAAPISSPTVGAVEALAVGDVDADGLLDVVVADRRGGRLRFVAGRGDGGFLPPSRHCGSPCRITSRWPASTATAPSTWSPDDGVWSAQGAWHRPSGTAPAASPRCASTSASATSRVSRSPTPMPTAGRTWRCPCSALQTRWCSSTEPEGVGSPSRCR